MKERNKNTKPLVYIVAPNQQYKDMFEETGWGLTDKLEDSDLVQFTGGSDVSPEMYGHHQHVSTMCDPCRDRREKLIYAAALSKNIPVAGICRGGQFLNVMCGGTMWQDVDGHCRDHDAMDLVCDRVVKVSSTHHQMMIPHNNPKSHEVLMVAYESKNKIKMGSLTKKSMSHSERRDGRDIEAVFYPTQNALCFQPHPEFYKKERVKEVYFDYIYEYSLRNWSD